MPSIRPSTRLTAYIKHVTVTLDSQINKQMDMNLPTTNTNKKIKKHKVAAAMRYICRRLFDGRPTAFGVELDPCFRTVHIWVVEAWWLLGLSPQILHTPTVMENISAENLMGLPSSLMLLPIFIFPRPCPPTEATPK